MKYFCTQLFIKFHIKHSLVITLAQTNRNLDINFDLYVIRLKQKKITNITKIVGYKTESKKTDKTMVNTLHFFKNVNREVFYFISFIMFLKVVTKLQIQSIYIIYLFRN